MTRKKMSKEQKDGSIKTEECRKDMRGGEVGLEGQWERWLGRNGGR